MIAFYHSRDLDGWCSGAIIKLKYPDCELIGYDYGQPFPFYKCWNQEVIMVDVSLQPLRKMIDLSSICKLTWIDHHKGAIDDYNIALQKEIINVTWKINAVLDTKLSACELTWKYLFPNMPIPTAVTLLGRYDTFRKTEGFWTETINFQYGMRLICNSPETFPKVFLFDEMVLYSQIEHVMKNGEIVLKYQSQVDESTAKKAFIIDFEGHPALTVNGIQFNSQAFKSVYDPEKHDIMMMFQYEPSINQWKFSIYTEKEGIDCAAIAKKYGGGGHPKAAGFQLTNDAFNDLIFPVTRQFAKT